MASGIEWAGSAAKRNCLADEDGTFDTRVPITALGIRVEDDLVWGDEPPALQKKEKELAVLGRLEMIFLGSLLRPHLIRP